MVLSFSITGQGEVRHVRDTDIRDLEWHGGPDLRSFYHRCWKSHQSGAHTHLVADLGGFPIGQVIIVWGGKPNHPHFPDIQSLRVHAAFRGMGIGSKLLDAAEQIIEARGFVQVGLSVGIENPHAKRLYNRRGYHSTGITYDDEWSYMDAQGQEVKIVEHVLDLVKKFERRPNDK